MKGKSTAILILVLILAYCSTANNGGVKGGGAFDYVQ